MGSRNIEIGSRIFDIGSCKFNMGCHDNEYIGGRIYLSIIVIFFI